MIRVSSPRFLTTLVIVGLAGLTAVRGLDLVRFSAVMTGKGADQAAAFKPFINKTGVASSARLAVIQLANEQSLSELSDAIVSHLGLAPVSAYEWVRLAQLRFNNGEGIDKALSALSLSNLTGPNETQAMTLRAVVGLSIWTILPVELRRPVISDAVESWNYMSAGQRQTLRRLLEVSEEQTRQEIRAAFLLASPSGEKFGSDLGLNTPAN